MKMQGIISTSKHEFSYFPLDLYQIHHRKETQEMLRFQPKRLFFILLPCILIIGAMIPIATFAATPKHQAVSATTTSETSTTVTIMNRCGPMGLGFTFEGPFKLATLKNGQEIEGSALVTGDDATHEQEALSIYAVAQSFIRLIFANTGSHSFQYEAHIAAGTTVDVVACYVLVRDDDESDFTSSSFFTIHTATVKYEVEQAGTNDAETSSGI
jgi:hypothetical protein